MLPISREQSVTRNEFLLPPHASCDYGSVPLAVHSRNSYPVRKTHQNAIADGTLILDSHLVAEATVNRTLPFRLSAICRRSHLASLHPCDRHQLLSGQITLTRSDDCFSQSGVYPFDGFCDDNPLSLIPRPLDSYQMITDGLAVLVPMIPMNRE